MNNSLRIDSSEALAAFIRKVDGLHDSLLHECALLHPGYVDQSGKMFGDAELLNAHLIFQSQFSDVLAVRIDLKGVSRFRIEPNRDFRLDGDIKGNEIILYLSGREASAYSEIRAMEMTYTMLGNAFLGPEYNLLRNCNESD